MVWGRVLSLFGLQFAHALNRPVGFQFPAVLLCLSGMQWHEFVATFTSLLPSSYCPAVSTERLQAPQEAVWLILSGRQSEGIEQHFKQESMSRMKTMGVNISPFGSWLGETPRCKSKNVPGKCLATVPWTHKGSYNDMKDDHTVTKMVFWVSIYWDIYTRVKHGTSTDLHQDVLSSWKNKLQNSAVPSYSTIAHVGGALMHRFL